MIFIVCENTFKEQKGYISGYEQILIRTTIFESWVSGVNFRDFREIYINLVKSEHISKLLQNKLIGGGVVNMLCILLDPVALINIAYFVARINHYQSKVLL